MNPIGSVILIGCLIAFVLFVAPALLVGGGMLLSNPYIAAFVVIVVAGGLWCRPAR